jgi:hypothetical protein
MRLVIEVNTDAYQADNLVAELISYIISVEQIEVTNYWIEVPNG